MEVVEEFVNGFCKTQNQSRMVLCEFRQEPDGSRTFLDCDCAYGMCPHSRECQLMAQATELWKAFGRKKQDDDIRKI